jgi:hypothetical protein
MAIDWTKCWMWARLQSIENIGGTDVTRDISGNNRHPVKVGSPTLSEANGFSGGSTANYFSLNSYITSLNGLVATSITGFFKGAARGVNKTAISIGGSSAATTRNIYPFDASGAAVYANNAIRYPGVGNNPALDANWHHIAHVVIANNENRLYIDGVEVTPNSAADCTLPNPCTGGALGCWHVGPAQSYGEQMRDVAIWTEGLSATNVGLLAGGALPPMGFPGNQRLSLGLRLGI